MRQNPETKADQVRALREARFERWQGKEEPPVVVKREIARAAVKAINKGGRPSKGQPWKQAGVSKAKYYRDRNK